MSRTTRKGPSCMKMLIPMFQRSALYWQKKRLGNPLVVIDTGHTTCCTENARETSYRSSLTCRKVRQSEVGTSHQPWGLRSFTMGSDSVISFWRETSVTTLPFYILGRFIFKMDRSSVFNKVTYSVLHLDIFPLITYHLLL